MILHIQGPAVNLGARKRCIYTLDCLYPARGTGPCWVYPNPWSLNSALAAAVSCRFHPAQACSTTCRLRASFLEHRCPLFIKWRQSTQNFHAVYSSYLRKWASKPPQAIKSKTYNNKLRVTTKPQFSAEACSQETHTAQPLNLLSPGNELFGSAEETLNFVETTCNKIKAIFFICEIYKLETPWNLRPVI